MRVNRTANERRGEEGTGGISEGEAPKAAYFSCIEIDGDLALLRFHPEGQAESEVRKTASVFVGQAKRRRTDRRKARSTRGG
jgi:hypothetical protein